MRESHAYSHFDANSHSDGYAYTYTYTDGDALTDAYVRTRRHARAMEHGLAIPDTGRALRLCADRDALLCVWWSVQWDACEQRQPSGPCHRDVASAGVDALYQ